MSCVACGSDVPDGARFCPACGAEQTASQEERKLVSVLFVDIVGSTARADGADPEDVRDRNQLYFTEARQRIEHYGGIVEKYIGDAVMAVFGTPLAKADDAERAVQAALSIIDGIHELNVTHPGLDLEVRGAVCTGEAVVAIDAAPNEPIATGDVANTAARLQNAAPPGGVLIGQQTYELVRHSFDLTPLEPMQAKGKREPVAAWHVLAPLGAPGARPMSGTPFVGRDDELEILSRVWDRAVDASRPHLVTILGPAGIGKTRLGRELSYHVERTGGIALWGRSLPYEERSPYRAAGQIIRKVADIYESDGVATARAKLATAISTLFPEPDADEATRYLSVVLGLGLDEPPDEAVHLQFAARMFIEHLAARDPVLVVFEDAHWADAPLLDLIDYLVTHVREARVVFLALARPELLETRRTFGGGMIGQTTLPLDALRSDEAVTVASALLPDVGPTAIERVVAAGEGNPLFLEELAASVVDDAGPEELPTTVLAAIAARIDALPSEPRTVLLHASVIGPTFWRNVLTAVMPSDGVVDALEALEDRGLIVRHLQSTVAGDVEYGFKHVLIRDGAYGTMPRAARRELHAAIARYLEDRLTDRADLGWLLAHHWTQAGDPTRAITYLLAAAQRAQDALAVDEAYDLLTRAFDLAEDEAERRRILFRRGDMLAKTGEFARADKELTDLVPELEGREQVEALLSLGMATHWTEQTERTYEVSHRAVTLSRDQGLDDLEPIALSLLSAAHAMRGDAGDVARSLELGTQATALWPEGQRQAEYAHHLHILGNPLYWSGRYQEAYELAMEAKSMGGLPANGAEFVLRGAGMTGLTLAGLGRYEEALEASESAIAAAQRLGRPDNVVINYSTLALREIFALEEARTRSQTVADRLGPSDFNMPWMNARADLIASELLLGELGTVERIWPRVWDDAQEVKAWEHWLVSGRLAVARAQLELGAGDLDDAVTWSRRALEMAASGGRPKYEAIALIALGQALTRQGLAEEALAQLRRAVVIADELGSPLVRWESREALAAAERAAGVDPEPRLTEAATIIREVAASLTPARAEVYVEAPAVRAVLEA
ncbi:MAG TPA: AAA family ATPase [Actinomycetota bacterium]|nr:AAA family ATPase [Actinomycetota bacterium]